MIFRTKGVESKSLLKLYAKKSPKHPFSTFPKARATPSLILRDFGNLTGSSGKGQIKSLQHLYFMNFSSKVVLPFRLARQLLEILHSVWMGNLSKPARGEDLALFSSKMILSGVVPKNALALFVSNECPCSLS